MEEDSDDEKIQVEILDLKTRFESQRQTKEKPIEDPASTEA